MRFFSAFTSSLVNPPTGFNYTPAFTVTRVGPTSFTHTFNIDAAKPAYTNTIYCGPGGTDTNSGLTYALRVRSLKQAITKANALADTIVRIYADPVKYYYSDVVSSIQASFADFGTINTGKTIVIEPNYVDSGFSSGNIVSIADQAMPAFVATADPNIYVSTYTTQTPASVAIDLANTYDGSPMALRKVNVTPANTAAPWPEINGKWQSGICGALWLDSTNKKLYVRLPDNRAPDSNLKVMTSTGSGNFRWTLAASATGTVWAQNVDFWGQNPIRVISTTTSNPVLYFKNCSSAYGNGNGTSFASGATTVYFVNHYSHDNLQDGFNYNGVAGAQSTCALFHEFACVAKRNGFGSDGDSSSNGSSCHANCRGFRVGGTYQSTNRVIHDIQDAQTWNLGITSGPSLITSTGEAAANFASGLQGTPGTAAGAKVWLDSCTSAAGSNYDYEAYAGGTLFTSNMPAGVTANDTGLGTITTYTG